VTRPDAAGFGSDTEHQMKNVCRVLLLGVVVAPLAAGQQNPLHQIDAYVEKARRDWGVPGIAVSIVKDDSVIFAKGYGTREVGRAAPVDPETLFAIGSATKAFTTASIAMLAEEGRIGWDDPATRYLPELQLDDPWVTRELTLRDLVTHRAGIERGDWLWESSPNTREEALHRMRFLERRHGFRAEYIYSNLAFLAAGQIVARLSGMSWDEFVRQRIFVPLGMTSSNTSNSALPRGGNVAAHHVEVAGAIQAIPRLNMDNVAPAGSINSNVLDMAQWVRLQLGGGVYRGKRLLRAESIREMHSPQMVVRKGEWMSSTSPSSYLMVPETQFFLYGLGWYLQDYRGRKIVHHGGVVEGMRALVGMLPEERLGVVVLSNQHPAYIDEAVLLRVFDHFLGGGPRDWSAEMLAGARQLAERARAAQVEQESRRVTGTSPSLPLSRYVGTYADSAYGPIRIAEVDGGLTIEWGLRVGDLAHWHFDTFRVTWRVARRRTQLVTFTLESEGTVATLVVPGEREFRRIRSSVAPGAGSRW
jgi:CubicO group peptidase (beta-lactamase class C family)